MTTNQAKGFPLQVTLQDLFAVSKLIQSQFEERDYYANLSDEEVADQPAVPADPDNDVEAKEAKDNSYARRRREESRVKRAELSALHERLTGEPLL